MSYLDDKFGPGTWRRSTDPKLPQRRTVRVEDGGVGAVYDDPVAKETVVDLTTISGGGAGSGHDTGAHVGGGQNVLSATGTAGVFPIRDGVSLAVGETNVPTTGTQRVRNDFTLVMARPVYADGAVQWFGKMAYNDGAQFGPNQAYLRVSTVNWHGWEFGDDTGDGNVFFINATSKYAATSLGYWLSVGSASVAGDGTSNVLVLHPGTAPAAPSTQTYLYTAGGAFHAHHASGAMVVDDGGPGDSAAIYLSALGGRRVNANLVIDAADYGVTGNVGDDASPGIEAAIAAALADIGTYPGVIKVLLPAGSIEPSRPIRLTPDPANFPNVGQQRIWLEGRGESTVIRPSYTGLAIGLHFDYSQLYPAVTTGGPFGPSSPCFQTYRLGKALFEYPAHDFPFTYYAALRQHGCGEFDGLGAFCFEGFINSDTSTSTLGATNCFFISGGYEGEQAGVLESACIFGLNPAYGPADNLSVQLEFAKAGTIVLHGSAPTTLNTWHHVAVSYDGNTVYLLADGAVVTSQTIGADTLVQHPCEGVHLGSGLVGFGGSDYLGRFHGLIGPWRLSSTAVYTGAYTVPTASFLDGGANDIFVINWDVNFRDMWKFHVGGTGAPGTSRTGWLMLCQESDFSNGAVFNSVVSHLKIYGNNGNTAGGVFAQNATASKFRHVDGLLVSTTMWTRAQTYDCSFDHVTHDGGGTLPGFIDANTGGNVYDRCVSSNASYPYMLSSGLNSMTNCRVGAWGKKGAGIRIDSGLLTITNLFCDNEGASAGTRGTVYAVDSFVYVRGSVMSIQPPTAEPMVTSARSVVDIETMVQSLGSISAWVDVISPTNARTRVKVLELAPDPVTFRTPPIISSNGSSLGVAVVEPTVQSQSFGEAILNKSKIANRQGQVDTTDGTVTTVCSVPLDPHSIYTLDIEVTGRQSGGDNWAIYKLSHACSRKTGLAVDEGAIGTPTSVGSGAGVTPPAGWGGVTIAVDDYQSVLVQVAGAAATSINWDANVVATRVQGTSSNVTGTAPNTVSGVRGWYRGSVGFIAGTSWADQSGIGNNLTLTGCTTGATLNSLATVHTNGTTDVAKINTFSKGSAGEITIVAVVKTYAASNAVAAYADGLFDGQIIAAHLSAGAGGANAQLGGVGNDISGVISGRTNLDDWVIVAITGKSGGQQYFYHETERQIGQLAASTIADSLPFQVGQGDMDLADVSVYDHVLTATELAGVVAYYKTAFAL